MANQDPPRVPRDLNIKIDQCLLNDLVSSDRSIKIEDKTDSSGDDKKPYLDLSITIRAGASVGEVFRTDQDRPDSLRLAEGVTGLLVAEVEGEGDNRKANLTARPATGSSALLTADKNGECNWLPASGGNALLFSLEGGDLTTEQVSSCD